MPEEQAQRESGKIIPADGDDSSTLVDQRRNNFWHSRTNSDTVLVFVHGIFADSRTCWLHRGGPREKDVFWPELITEDQRLGQPSIFLAGYYTGLEAGDFPMAQCAREVLDALKRPEIDGTPPALSARRIIFVCHSTGGIVVRYMLESHRELFVDKAIGLALIASPSLGSGWASLASFAATYYNQHLGQQLRWDDRELEDLHWRFRELVNQKDALMPGLFGMEAAEHTMIFRDRIPRWIRWALPPRLKIVTTLSAGQYFGAVKILPGTNHFTAVKPSSVYHPAHEFLVDFVDAFNGASQRSQPSTESRVVRGIPQVMARPASSTAGQDQDTEWPVESHETGPMFGFVSEAGFGSDSSVAVISYIAVENLADFNDRFVAALIDIEQDPYFQPFPSIVAAIKSRRIDYEAVDVDVRARLIELLGGLIFEAYVCFSRQQPQADDLFGKMSAALLFQRLRAAGNEPVDVTLSPSFERREEALRATTEAATERIRRTDRRDVRACVHTGQTSEAGVIVAEYVSQIVCHRLSAPTSLDARAFERIHPTKLRLIQDFDRGEFFSRRRRFTE